MVSKNDIVAGLTRRGLLQQLMDNISDHIYFKDTSSRILLLNRAYTDWFNFGAPEALIGKTVSDQRRHSQIFWIGDT